MEWLPKEPSQLIHSHSPTNTTHLEPFSDPKGGHHRRSKASSAWREQTETTRETQKHIWHQKSSDSSYLDSRCLSQSRFSFGRGFTVDMGYGVVHTTSALVPLNASSQLQLRRTCHPGFSSYSFTPCQNQCYAFCLIGLFPTKASRLNERNKLTASQTLK